MKKTCGECKALEQISIVSKNGEMRCLLNYKICCTKTINFIEVEHKPLEMCEKPLTHKRLIDLLEKKIIYAPHVYHNPAIRTLKIK